MPESDFFQKVEMLKNGTLEVIFEHKKYLLSKQTSQDSKRITVYADEVGGTDFISFNMYKLKSGWTLKPCEMPVEKVTKFIIGLTIFVRHN